MYAHRFASRVSCFLFAKLSSRLRWITHWNSLCIFFRFKYLLPGFKVDVMSVSAYWGQTTYFPFEFTHWMPATLIWSPRDSYLCMKAITVVTIQCKSLWPAHEKKHLNVFLCASVCVCVCVSFVRACVHVWKQYSTRCQSTPRRSCPSSSSSRPASAPSLPCWPCSHTSFQNSWASSPKLWVSLSHSHTHSH